MHVMIDSVFVCGGLGGRKIVKPSSLGLMSRFTRERGITKCHYGQLTRVPGQLCFVSNGTFSVTLRKRNHSVGIAACLDNRLLQRVHPVGEIWTSGTGYPCSGANH